MIPSSSDFDPAAVYEGVRTGNRRAELELVQRFQPRIKTFLHMRNLERAVAEELGQEILIAALLALREGRLREPEQLSAFVYGIARNLLNDYLRKRSREKLEPLLHDRDFPMPAPSFEDSERFQMARREIETLEPTDRRILMMTLVDGMKPGEVASSLRLSSEVVRQRKSRALKKLAERFNRLSRFGADLRLSE